MGWRRSATTASAGTSARQAVWRAKRGAVRSPSRAAQARPQSIGADQRDAALLERIPGRERGDGDAVAVHGEILDPRTQAKRDIGMGAHRVEQHRLQIAAMDHPIGRAVAVLDGGAERRAREHARGLRVRSRAVRVGRPRRDRAACPSRARSGRATRWARAGCRRRSLPGAAPGRTPPPGSRAAAIASAAVSPPMPAPAMMTVREIATAHSPL